VLATGAASLLILAGILLVVTGVFRPFASEPESSAFVQALPPPDGVVVDNLDAGFVIESGEWGTCDNGDCEGVSYGADFRYADPDCASCRARFDLRSADAGEYELWTWWPKGEDRATDTPFTIQHGNESLTVRVDQRQNGSTWVRLATLMLAQGEPISVQVSGTSTGYANADAVALTPAGTWQPGAPVGWDLDPGMVVDNLDPGFSIQTGEWETNEDDDAYDGEFLYAPPDCTSCRAQFDLTVADAGEFDLWMWWPQGDDRATDTPYTVHYSGGSLTVNVDQRNSGTRWVRLATLSLDQGESVQVIVAGSETGYANADAVALTPAGSWTPR
jgi:hypothetical protein